MNEFPSKLSTTATETMLETFAEINGKLSSQSENIRKAVDEGIIRKEEADSFNDWVFCSQLSMLYYAEANRALQAGAWFSATVVAASALEAVLMAKCFAEQNSIKALPKWSTLEKSYQQNFGLFIRSLDLGKLLEIAKHLSWFPTGLPDSFVAVFSPLVDESTMTYLRNIFQDMTDVGQVCANHLREYRNLVHPAVCLRKGQIPNHEVGMTGTLLMMVAISALQENK